MTKSKKGKEQEQLQRVSDDVQKLKKEHRKNRNVLQLQQGILDIINTSDYWAVLESHPTIARPPNFKPKTKKK